MNALRREFDSIKSELAELIATAGCASCNRLPAARVVISNRVTGTEDVTVTPLLGEVDEWAAIGGACAGCGRRPGFDLTLHVVESIEEAEELPESTPQDLHLPILPYQGRFLVLDAKFAALIGGLGSGKSFAAAMWLIARVLKYPHGRHYVIGGTVPQLRLGTHVTLRGMLDALGIGYRWNKTSLAITITNGPAKGAEITFWSSEVYEGLKSHEIDTAVLEEVQVWSRDPQTAIEFIAGRMRQSPPTKLHHPDLRPETRVAANPPRTLTHMIYERWIAEPAEGDPERPPVILTTTLDNTLIPRRDEYLAELRRTMSKDVYAVEVMGEFREIGASRVYGSFDRAKHCRINVPGLPKVEYNPRLPLLACHDFGSRMRMIILAQRIVLPMPVPGFRNELIYVVDEIALEHSSSLEALKAFEGRYPASFILDGNTTRRVVINYGDASGENMTTAVGESDWAIVRDRMRAAGYVGEVRKPKANPPIVDRVEAVNMMLEDADGRIGILIDAQKCPVFVKDLATVKFKDAPSRIIDHGDSRRPLLSHASDAFGYLVHYEFKPRYGKPGVHVVGVRSTESASFVRV